MKKLIFAILMLSPVLVMAQRVPQDDEILARILSSDSEYNYASMMMRYLAGDTTLTEDQYFYLYYGFAFEPDYDPRRTLPGEDTILEIFARTERPTCADAERIIEAAKENMLVDPFSPGNINMMTFAYNILGDTINEIISADRFTKIVKAIESSGTGTRESSPWHILRFTHANDIVAARGFTISNRQVRSRTVEYIQVARNSSGIRGFFFDFSRIYRVAPDAVPEQRRSNWELNGIPLSR